MITEKLKLMYQPYAAHFEKMHKVYNSLNLGGPFLISPENTSYNCQKRKLLIVGREEKKWISMRASVRMCMRLYEDFHNQEERVDKAHWRITAQLETAMKVDLFGAAHTKLNRFTLNGKTPNGKFLSELLIFDRLILDELCSLKPDCIIFLTGPASDWRLNNLFEGLELSTVSNFQYNELVRMKHSLLPIESYRTYHPEFLIRSKMNDRVIKFMNSLV